MRKPWTWNKLGAREQLKRDLEDGIKPKLPEEPKGVTIEHAFKTFISDCESRNFNPLTLAKYRLLERNFVEHAKARGLAVLGDISGDCIRDFRKLRKLGARTLPKNSNGSEHSSSSASRTPGSNQPCKSDQSPQVKTLPRIPFSEKEIQNLLAQAKDDRELAFVLRRFGIPASSNRRFTFTDFGALR